MSASAHSTCLQATTRETRKRRLWGPLFSAPIGPEGESFTCMARSSRVAFHLILITDDGRQTTISRDEDLRTIRTT